MEELKGFEIEEVSAKMPQEIEPQTAEVKQTVPTREKNLSVKTLFSVYGAIFLGFLLLLPMIYIKSQIYYYSRDINALWSEYSILMEENRDLRQKVEIIRFKHQVLDTLDIK